jgi:cation transport regulator ChaC
MSSVAEITEAIERLEAREQVQLLSELPRHLKIDLEDLAWLRASEKSFEFWDNPEDAIYDDL